MIVILSVAKNQVTNADAQWSWRPLHANAGVVGSYLILHFVQDDS
jgi:hypothetical protein